MTSDRLMVVKTTESLVFVENSSDFCLLALTLPKHQFWDHNPFHQLLSVFSFLFPIYFNVTDIPVIYVKKDFCFLLATVHYFEEKSLQCLLGPGLCRSKPGLKISLS